MYDGVNGTGEIQMIYGNTALKQQYGTMEDRKNSFDDSKDINVFRTIALKNPDFQKYYKKLKL